jgi:S-adenosylmethionine decarboxylase
MYKFEGNHYIASYSNCDHCSLIDIENLKKCIYEAVIKSGVHILNEVSHPFCNKGFTMCLLLSESHCSIHTYPEYNSIFIDLFTCGNNTDFEIFEKVMKDYLLSSNIQSKIIKRN